VIATYGSRNGTFAAINGPVYGWNVIYDYNGGTAIALQPPQNSGVTVMVR
jgi:hypothetical protein